MRFFAAAFIFCGVASSGQAPQVPHKMHFAGMTLSINAEARSEIQKDVDALTISPRYFNIKVERAKTYFPIIEKIFKDENVPDDLKYLVLQESALISDAVSTSNAVGYWQFKLETGRQMGLKINKRVDERMNIVASTKGAANYFKQSNHYFNNWLYVVQSYQMGIGGTMRSVGEEHFGARHMEVTLDTYWYVKKYLAHKVAFEHALGGAKGQVLVTPVLASGVSLDEISQKSGIDVEKLKSYNKWMIDGTVPDDAEYSVVIPKGELNDFNTLWLSSNNKSGANASSPVAFKETKLNGLRAVVAPSQESVTALAKRANVEVSDFIRWNEVPIDWHVTPGQIYYLQRKFKSSNQSTYTTKVGETLWTVSQAHGMRLRTLKKLNANLLDELKPGTIVYLAEQPGRNNSEAQMVQLDHSSPFEWGISGKGERDYVISQTAPEITSENKKESVVVGKETTTTEIVRSTHEVKTTDTLYSIARLYGLSVKELMDMNDKKDFEIKPGQKLIIK
jgi:membrane-bound lytic murein transglycosylase D